ncbi:hypothetical protein MKX01_027191 [Papaver californicum]|nr:hypothetical protein MKX01_027191 [Papaver californicum]
MGDLEEEEGNSSAAFSSSYEQHSSHVPSTTTTAKTHKTKAGRKKFKETRHPIYRGVRERNGGRWVCEIRQPYTKSKIWLGTFPIPEMAARAYDVAALALRGKSTPLNFNDSSMILPRPTSTNSEDIRLAAIEAAEAFRPHPINDISSASSSSVALLPSISNLDIPFDEYLPSSSAGTTFLDEEALFNMPGLLDSMAEGMLLTPLAMKKGFRWLDDNDVDSDIDVPLWRD